MTGLKQDDSSLSLLFNIKPSIRKCDTYSKIIIFGFNWWNHARCTGTQ